MGQEVEFKSPPPDNYGEHIRREMDVLPAAAPPVPFAYFPTNGGDLLQRLGRFIQNDIESFFNQTRAFAQRHWVPLALGASITAAAFAIFD